MTSRDDQEYLEGFSAGAVWIKQIIQRTGGDLEIAAACAVKELAMIRGTKAGGGPILEGFSRALTSSFPGSGR